ncbi:hypothetical protein MRX96_024032 [Rhipicephalus microplus]
MPNCQAARFPLFATPLPVVLALTFQHHFGAESSTPCIPCRTPVYVRHSASSQGDIYGLNEHRRPPLDTCLPQVPANQRNTISALGTFTPPDSRFSHAHLDLIGPLPPIAKQLAYASLR